MADIFVSYSREDRERVLPLVNALERQGWTVWWDREISPGDSFEERIEVEISDARVVLVVWSRHSINSRWVRNEALDGLDRDILVPVRLDDVRIPVAFRQTQFASFLHLPALLNEAEFHNLVDAVHSKLEPDRPDHYVRPRRFGLHPGAWAALLLVAGAAVLLVQWLWRDDGSEIPAKVAEAATVAVLRFEASALDGTRQIADDLAERVRSSLVSVGSIAVVPRAAAWGVPGDQGLALLGARLGAGSLIHGSVRRLDQEVLIEVRDFDVAAGTDGWSAEYAFSDDAVLQLHDAISRDVLVALGVAPAILERLSPTRNGEAYRHFLEGQQQLRDSAGVRAFGIARRAFEQAIERDPSFAEAHAGLCRVRLTMYVDSGAIEDFEAGERHCHRALTLDRSSVTAVLALGDLYAASNQPDKARMEYRQALALDPALADAYIGLGKVLAASGENDQAEGMMLEAVSRQPGYWRAFNALGSFYISGNRLPEAIDAFSRMRLLEPDDVWSYNNLGAARFLSGDLEGAIREWQRAVELDASPGALSNLGTALFLTRDFDAAAERYRQALAFTPEDHRLWGNLGDALRFVESADVVSAYRRQLELAAANLAINANDAAALGRSAVSYAYLGDADDARDAVDRALRVAPNDMQVLYDAAATYAGIGDPVQAVSMIERAIAAGYDAHNIVADALFDGLRDVPDFIRLAEGRQNPGGP